MKNYSYPKCNFEYPKYIVTSKSAVVDICINTVDIYNDTFTRHNVLWNIQNYSFSFSISEMKIMTCNNWIEDIWNGSFCS